MRLFIALAAVVFFISAVVAFIDLPSKSETGCRASITGSSLCLQYPRGGNDINEDFDLLKDVRQQPPVAVHQKPEPDSIYTQQEKQQPHFVESIPARRWLATSMSATGLACLKEKIGATWTVRSRIVKARSEGLTPWYGMALGLMCTTLAAVMLG